MTFHMILRINGILTYIESEYMFYNDILRSNKNLNDNIIIYIYNHGFPDYSVIYNENEYDIEVINKGDFFIERLKFKKECDEVKKMLSTRFCNKMRDVYVNNSKYLPNHVNIFVTFNTNGIRGNTNGDFYNKTLIKDMYDIETIINFFCSYVFINSKLFMIGLSTGAFLTFSYSTGFTKKDNLNNNQLYFIPHPNLIGVICIACVDDIPSSFCLDFDSNQIDEFNKYGFCNLKIKVPINDCRRNNSQINNNVFISSNYIKSYDSFPKYEFLLKNKQKAINLPILLIHGTKDNNVPYNMSLNLLKLNTHFENNLKNYMYEFDKDYFHYLGNRINNLNHNHNHTHIHNNQNQVLRFNQFKEFASQHHSKFIKLYQLKDANHLITNSKHMKKAQDIISLFVLEIINYKKELSKLN